MTTPTDKSTPTFEQVRDAIVARMGGHTIDVRYGEAFELFMALLGQVKSSECAITFPASAIGAWISVKDRLPKQGDIVVLWDAMFQRADTVAVSFVADKLDPDYTHWLPIPPDRGSSNG